MAVGFAEEITGNARLRELIKPPSRKVSHKAIYHIDELCARFIAASISKGLPAAPDQDGLLKTSQACPNQHPYFTTTRLRAVILPIPQRTQRIEARRNEATDCVGWLARRGQARTPTRRRSGSPWLGVRLDRGMDWGRIGTLVREAYGQVAGPELLARLGPPVDIEPPTETLDAEDFDPLSAPRAREIVAGCASDASPFPRSPRRLSSATPAGAPARRRSAP